MEIETCDKPECEDCKNLRTFIRRFQNKMAACECRSNKRQGYYKTYYRQNKKRILRAAKRRYEEKKQCRSNSQPNR